MSQYFCEKDASLKSLVDLGAKGHFPLFEKSWAQELDLPKCQKLNTDEKSRAIKIIERLGKHKTLERKKTVLASLEEGDRLLFVRLFLCLVENKIRDDRPEMQ